MLDDRRGEAASPALWSVLKVREEAVAALWSTELEAATTW
jgi:hypothetical protein